MTSFFIKLGWSAWLNIFCELVYITFITSHTLSWCNASWSVMSIHIYIYICIYIYIWSGIISFTCHSYMHVYFFLFLSFKLLDLLNGTINVLYTVLLLNEWQFICWECFYSSRKGVIRLRIRLHMLTVTKTGNHNCLWSNVTKMAAIYLQCNGIGLLINKISW